MKIVIKQLRDSPFLIEIIETMTILDVKTTISQINGILPRFQQLILRGNVLDNSTSVESLRLREMGSLYLVAKAPKKPKACGLPKLLSQASSNGFCSLIDSLRENNPQLAFVFNDRETISENLEAYRSPQTRFELLKSFDRTMNLAEMRVGGFQDIVKHHQYVETTLETLMEQCRPERIIPTVIPKAPKGPSTDPLPNPFFTDSSLDSLFIFSSLDSNTNELQIDQTKSALAILGLIFANKKEFMEQSDDEKEKDPPERAESTPYVQIFHDEGNTKVFPPPAPPQNIFENSDPEPESSSDADSFSDVDID